MISLIKKTLAEKKREDKASYCSGANIPGSASGRSGVGSRFGGREEGGDCGYDGCGGLYIGCWGKRRCQGGLAGGDGGGVGRDIGASFIRGDRLNMSLSLNEGTL